MVINMPDNSGLEKITNKIFDQSNEECRKIITEAENSAKEIEDSYKSKAYLLKKNILDKAEKQASAKIAGANSSSSLNNRNSVLKTKVSCIDKAFEESEKLLYSLDEKRQIKLFSSLLESSLKECNKPNTEIRILFASETKKYGEQIIKNCNVKDIIISDETIDGSGFIIYCGDIEINCTGSRLISSARIKLEKEVSDILFHHDK